MRAIAIGSFCTAVCRPLLQLICCASPACARTRVCVGRKDSVGRLSPWAVVCTHASRRRGCSCTTRCAHAGPTSGRRRYYSIFFSGPLTSCEREPLCIFSLRALATALIIDCVLARSPPALFFHYGATALAHANAASRVHITQQRRGGAQRQVCADHVLHSFTKHMSHAHIARDEFYCNFISALLPAFNCLKRLCTFLRRWSFRSYEYQPFSISANVAERAQYFLRCARALSWQLCARRLECGDALVFRVASFTIYARESRVIARFFLSTKFYRFRSYALPLRKLP